MRRTIALTALVGALLTGGAVTAVSATAAPAPAAAATAAAGCSVTVDTPKITKGQIVTVVRRTGCKDLVTLTLELRKVRGNLPDKSVGKRSADRFGNGNMTVVGSCAGKGTYFGEAKTSTGTKVKSTRVQLCS